jgi:hypothetical protein
MNILYKKIFYQHIYIFFLFIFKHTYVIVIITVYLLKIKINDLLYELYLFQKII